MPITDWIYPTNERGDYHLVMPNGTAEVSPQRLLNGIEQNPEQVDPWILRTGFRTMLPGDAVWIYAANPYQYVCALAQTLEVYPDGDDWYVSLAWRLDATRRLMQHPVRRSAFGQIAQRAAVRADERTASVLDRWLRSERIQLADLDGAPDPSSAEDTRLRTMRAIVQRQGQAKFRQRLLSAYGGRCAITGESTEAVLEAAHIEPYRGGHSNVVTNGLLLRADLHTLFDLHMVGVDHHRNVAVSSRLAASSYAKLHGRPLALPKRISHRPSKHSLAAHLRQLR